MKRPLFLSVIFIAFISQNAHAACTGATDTNRMDDLGTLLEENTVCVGFTGAWMAQEQHLGSGVLVDFKRGASDPVDPTEQVGTWAVSANGQQVTYNYGGPDYIFQVHTSSGVGMYDFCSTNSSNNAEGVSIRPGLVGCDP